MSEPVHKSDKLHTAILTDIQSLLNRSEDLSDDARAFLHLHPVNPSIEFVPRAGETQDADGNWRVAQPDENHLRWDIEEWIFAPGHSLDPDIHYANGEERVEIVDGIAIGVGHAHLTVYKKKDADAVHRHYRRKNPGPRPASLEKFGAHKWYNPRKLDNGKFRIEALNGESMHFEPGVVYVIQFELVHIDDQKPLPHKHLDDAFSLTSYMIVPV